MFVVNIAFFRNYRGLGHPDFGEGTEVFIIVKALFALGDFQADGNSADIRCSLAPEVISVI